MLFSLIVSDIESWTLTPTVCDEIQQGAPCGRMSAACTTNDDHVQSSNTPSHSSISSVMEFMNAGGDSSMHSLLSIHVCLCTSYIFANSYCYLLALLMYLLKDFECPIFLMKLQSH